jgi:hypothetical protein
MSTAGGLKIEKFREHPAAPLVSLVVQFFSQKSHFEEFKVVLKGNGLRLGIDTHRRCQHG